ncbi:hypothetical protein GCM10023177_09930 [Streptomyces violaceoruber]|nr:hypothetical protein JCM4020_65320 [Streptomyces coelicolor]
MPGPVSDPDRSPRVGRAGPGVDIGLRSSGSLPLVAVAVAVGSGVLIEPRDHGLGRSRGGFTTKLHLAIERGQKPLSIVVTAGTWRRTAIRTRTREGSRSPHWAGPTAGSP